MKLGEKIKVSEFVDKNIFEVFSEGFEKDYNKSLKIKLIENIEDELDRVIDVWSDINKL
jgi:hypothetical protein